MSKPIIDYKEWDVTSNKYMPPKINKQQGKAINMINTKTNRSIHVTTPLMHILGDAKISKERMVFVMVSSVLHWCQTKITRQKIQKCF